MLVTLRPKYSFKVPIEAESIDPDLFAERSVKEIGELPIWEGNRRQTLSRLFKIDYEATNPAEKVTIKVIGDVSKVRRIGSKMSSGEMIVEGDAGMHLGEEMKGGKITVNGDVDSWAGSMMKKGTIEIMGNAGDYVGAPYRGSTRGMTGGTITIHGDAGNEVGCYMRKGLIKIGGNVGQFVGIHMRNGTIHVKGDCAGRAGAQMIHGKIVISGHIPSVLPAFTIDDISSKVKVNGEKVDGPFFRFIGDLTENGDGKLFVSKTENPHLNTFEEYL